MIEEEVKQQAEKTCIMKDKNDRACYVAGFLGGFYEGEKSRYEYEEKQTQTIIDQQTKIALLSQKVYDLQKQNDKLTEAKEIIRELLKYIFTPEGFESLSKETIKKAEAFLKGVKI